MTGSCASRAGWASCVCARWAIGLGVVLVYLATGCAARGYVERQPLEAFWEQHMLAGTAGNFWFDGQRFERLDTSPRRPYEEAKGSSFSAAFTDNGVSVSYGQETAWFGLLRRGGWGIEGGLLQRIQVVRGSLDLYGKLVSRTYPYFPFPPHRDTREDISLEIFLLHRPVASAAVIMRKWVFDGIPSRDAAVELRARLEYAPNSKRAVVTVTGLAGPFQEGVDLSPFLH